MKIPSKLKNIKRLLITKVSTSIEFDILTSQDANGNSYYYLHFKSRDEDVINEVYTALCLLEKHKLIFTSPLFTEHKTIIWVPFNQKLKYLIHSEKEVYELVSSKKLLKKDF